MCCKQFVYCIIKYLYCAQYVIFQYAEMCMHAFAKMCSEQYVYYSIKYTHCAHSMRLFNMHRLMCMYALVKNMYRNMYITV